MNAVEGRCREKMWGGFSNRCVFVACAATVSFLHVP